MLTSFPTKLARFSPRARWIFIVISFVLIAFLDFSTPSEYILAYLYTVPILISVSFLKPNIAKVLLGLATLATLLNLFIPENVSNIPSVLVNRLLATIAIAVSAWFMVQYIQYQDELKQKEAILLSERNLSQIREDFMATLSHDLKTPLLGQQKTLQHLAQGTLGALSVEQIQVVKTLENSSQNLLHLVENLLAIYRYDHMGVPLDLKPLNLDLLIAEVLLDFQIVCLDKNIHLDYDCVKTPSLIKGDSLQLRRVLTNLIQNASKYSPNGSHIKVKLQEESSSLKVSIEDEGPGFSQEDLAHFSTRFYQGKGQRQQFGTGLGLYLSRQLVEAHGGRLWAENHDPSGCQVCFTLPFQETNHD